MKIDDIKIEIRLALLDLGRDPHEKLPTKRPALEAKRDLLRIEQARSAKSKLRPEIKAALLARAAR
jgi:hypothetical protein